MIAEAKLERLVRAGIIGPEWLDRENRNPPLPNAAAAPAQEPAERLGPRILQL